MPVKYIKKLLILFIFFISTNSLAQTESQIGWIAKFGAAVGFTPTIIFPNYDAINPQLTKIGMDKLNGPMMLWGGGGYAYVMIIDNLRLGGFGFTGAKSEKSKILDLNNQVDYSLGGGAVSIEYTFPFVKNMALSAGLLVGSGSLEINIYQNSGQFVWSDIWDDIKTGKVSSNKSLTLNNSFYFINPTINLDFPITRFIALRGGIGYQFTLGDDWEIENGKSLSGVPNNLNGDGFIIQTGIFFGLFAF